MAKSQLVLVALASLVAGALAQTATPILISANPDAGSGSAAPFTDLLAAVKKNPALSELLKLVQVRTCDRPGQRQRAPSAACAPAGQDTVHPAVPQANGLADELAAFNGTLFAPSNDAIAAFIKKFANATGHDFNKDGKVDIDDLDEKYDLVNVRAQPSGPPCPAPRPAAGRAADTNRTPATPPTPRADHPGAPRPPGCGLLPDLRQKGGLPLCVLSLWLATHPLSGQPRTPTPSKINGARPSRLRMPLTPPPTHLLLQVFTTALGEAFNVSFVNGTATLRADQGTSAHIVKAVSALGEDVKLGNGAILHVIDALLLPSVEASSITAVPAPAPSIAKSPSAAKAAVDAAKEKLGNGAAQSSAPAAALLAVALTMLLA